MVPDPFRKKKPRSVTAKVAPPPSVTVVARLAPICVEQYNQDSEKDQKLKELKEEGSWKRDDYVEKQGWATMPGEKEADSKVAEKCAEMLMQLG